MQHRRNGRALTCACLAAIAVVTSSCASGTTDAPLEVTDQAATLRATGSPRGEATQWWFEYGKTTSYGSSTPRRDGGSGTAEQTVSARVTGLTPDTGYHYRACASNRSGTGCAKDVTFRTGSPGLLPGFQETTAWSGLEAPTAVRFAPDGRVFVAEKPGGIKVFDGLGDTTPTTFANLRTQVSHYHDQGLLGLAIHPQFPAEPYVYALYTHDAPVGGTAPTWNDLCPTPPGPNPNGCVTSGRLSHLEARGNVSIREQVLVEDWCQQSFTHSVGDLGFGSDGALYVSAGDGASPDFVDYGQFGVPRNPCGDPPVAVGGAQSAPTSQGGALRSQDRLTPSDPQTLDGALLRVDALTGAGLSSNPFASSTDPKARRLVAYGLRNPFRFTVRPGTRDVWIGDVGWNTSEEINRVPDAGDAVAENFGWPCHEGNVRQGGYDAANLNLCEILYATGGPTAPTYSYQHSAKVTQRGDLPGGHLVDLGDGLQSGGQRLAGRVRRRALLRRLRPRMHLGDAQGREWPARGCRAQVVPHRRQRARGSPVRAGRRAVLRRHREWADPADCPHGRKPGAARGGPGHADQRQRAARGAVQRRRLLRPRR